MSELPGLPEEVADALLVSEDGSSREQYEIASLTFTSGAGEDKVINLIPITIINGKLLVAVPLGAWHKTAGRRLLPRTVFTKAVKVEVLAVNSDEPSECLDAAPLKLWVGYLDASTFVGLEIGASPIADCDVSDVLAEHGGHPVWARSGRGCRPAFCFSHCNVWSSRRRRGSLSRAGYRGGGDRSWRAAEVFGWLSGEDPGESSASCSRFETQLLPSPLHVRIPALFLDLQL